MNMKWLAALAVITLLVACDNTTTDSGGEKPSTGDKSGEHDHDHDHDGDHKDGDKDESPKSDADSDKDKAKPKDDNSFEGEKVGANDSEGKGEKEDVALTLTEKFDEIKSAYNKKQGEFRKMMRNLSPEERTEEIFQNHADAMSELGDKAFDLVKDNLDDEAAFEALVWASANGSEKVRDTVVDVLLDKFIESEDLAGFCTTLSRRMANQQSEDASEKKLQKQSPHKPVQAAAKYGLIGMYQNMFRYQEYAKKNPDMDIPEFIAQFDADSVDMEELYQDLADNYGELSYGNRNYKELAERALFEIRYLSIGKVAPDIEGSDLDGEDFKLSDYRGKVVVLDFWGDW